MEATVTTDVIIVGAGPTGLSLAAQLMRYNINFVIVDKKTGVTELSKALIVHARTLEIYDQLGLAQTAIERGTIVRGVTMLHNGKVGADLDFSGVGQHLSPFPFLLIFEQSKNEALLTEHLERAGQAVQWQTELTDISQDQTGVAVSLKGPDGHTHTVKGQYLVGCDGAGSPTRHLLNIGFEGSTYPRLFFVADLDTDFAGDRQSLCISLEGKTPFFWVPMKDEQRWRLIGALPEYEAIVQEHPEDEVNLTFEQIADTIAAQTNPPLTMIKAHWFSTYKVHTLHATAFSSGRCFLAGDAAHVHTPVGGQGMNTGIQDVYNLAWKLALVIRSQADDRLLESYNVERLANAKRLVHTTDQLFDQIAGDTWYQRLFRNDIVPHLASFAWHFDTVRETIFPILAQLAIRYSESPLTQPAHEKHAKINPGEQFPYLHIHTTSLYETLRAPTFHLMRFTNEDQTTDQGEAVFVQNSGGLITSHIFPLEPQIAERFGTDQPFSVLVRPDGYIGLLAPTLSDDNLKAYFAAFGATANLRQP